MIPGSAPPVDVFPVLKYIPEFLAKWKTEARRVRETVLDDARRWFHDGEKQHVQIQKDPDSVLFEGLIAKLLKERDLPDEKDEGRSFTDLELGYIGQALVGAAVDTTSATFESLMCCFAAFPETLRLAQEEVDRVSGTEKPPTGEHISKLPYLKACLYEVSLLIPVLTSAGVTVRARRWIPILKSTSRSSVGDQRRPSLCHIRLRKTTVSAITFSPREPLSLPTPGPFIAAKSTMRGPTSFSRNVFSNIRMG